MTSTLHRTGALPLILTVSGVMNWALHWAAILALPVTLTALSAGVAAQTIDAGAAAASAASAAPVGPRPSAATSLGCANDTQPRDTLDEIVAAHARGDLPALAARLDPAMFGYANFLDSAQLDFARAKLARIHLFEMQWQCGPDLVALHTRWEKRYLDAVSYQPQLDSGQMSVLMFRDPLARDPKRWRMAALAGANPFGAIAGSAMSIEFGPTIVAQGANSPVQLLLLDSDLVRRASIDVVLRSSTGDREIFTVPAVAPGRFQRATLPITTGAATPGNGVLEVAAGGRVLLEVVDEQPGPGRPPAILSRYATVIGNVAGGGGTPLDTTPDPFFFALVAPQPPSTLVTSSVVIIRGINAPAVVAVLSGEVSVDGGSFTTAPAPVREGASLRVRARSSSTPGAAVTVLLSVGGVSASFVVVTASGGGLDQDPDPFAFTPVTLSATATDGLAESNSVLITGINTATPVSIAGGSYAINGGPWQTTPGSVQNGDRLQIQLRISGLRNPDVATLTVGPRSANFVVTWINANPDPLVFAPVTVAPATVVTSNTVTVSGVNVPVPYGIRNGSISINGGPFSSVGGTALNGDRITLRTTSAATSGAVVTVEITVGLSPLVTWVVRSR